MKNFGWIMFSVGAVALSWAAFIGVGIGNVIAPITFGSAMMISGAIIASVSEVNETLVKSHDEMKRMIGIPEELVPEVTVGSQTENPLGETKPASWLFQGEFYQSEEAANQARQEYIRKYVKKGA